MCCSPLILSPSIGKLEMQEAENQKSNFDGG